MKGTRIDEPLLPRQFSPAGIGGSCLIGERGLPLADAFAAATALAASATLVTTDPHLRAVEGEVPILWLR